MPSERDKSQRHERREENMELNLRVEAVVPDHREALLWQGRLTLEDMV